MAFTVVTEAATTRGRLVGLAALVAVPLAGLALLLSVPELDVVWEHHPSHFWLVLLVAVVNVVLAVLTSEAASQRNDARLFLVSLAMLSSAGFLALHALATPQVLLSKPNEGFVIATPVGLVLASFFAAASALPHEEGETKLSPATQRWLRSALLIAIAGWAIASFAQVEFLSRTPGDEAPVILRLLSPVAIVLYAFAAIRYVQLYDRRRRTLPLAIAIAFVLLAEAMVAIAFGRSWHATWWEWHVLMAVAFGTILLAARAEYRRERSVAGTFGGVYLERTLDRIDRRHSDALRSLTTAIKDGAPLAPVVEDLRSHGFTSDEVVVMERSARELSRVDTLLRRYVGPQLADRLEEEPTLAQLGGRESEVTVLFADLAGFTSFSEGRSPGEVIDMVNAYWERAVPMVVTQGGLIERFAGDAILVLFNALGDQPDHPLRACRAALAMRDATEQVAAAHPGWPRFRIGVNTGPAVVGNVGAGAQRSFAALGDTTNVAARLQAQASPGQVLAGAATIASLGDAIVTRPVGSLSLKGKSDAVEAFELV
jgi:class 3 adenylate cyclase